MARQLAASCTSRPEQFASKLTGTWPPSVKDIDQLEKGLGVALVRAIEDANWIGPRSEGIYSQWESVGNHVRQYGGVLIGDEKVILVHGAPISFFDFDGPHLAPYLTSDEWRSGGTIGGADMGPSEFSTVYSPITGKFAEFAFCGTIAGRHLP
jgi:hypothetical protein